jgi:RNA exonuclease 1
VQLRRVAIGNNTRDEKIMSAKKYKLSALAEDGSKKACAFFASAAGCRNGDSCKFLHTSVSAAELTSTPKSSGSVVSSESSEGEIEDFKREVVVASKEEDTLFVKNTGEMNDASKKNKKKRKSRTSEEESLFANPKNKKQKSALSEQIQNETKVTISAEKEPEKKQNKKVKLDLKSATPPRPTPALPSFRSLDLPIASFSLMATKETLKEIATKEYPPATSNATSASTASPTPPASNVVTYPRPTSSAAQIWLAVVEETQAKTKFGREYDFSRYQTQDEESGIPKSAWVEAKPYNTITHGNAPQAIAIDCEMCETKDPVSGKKDHRALCRISIIDAATDEVLLDTLVKPAWPVVDYRTWINGIAEEHLENVQFTLRHAQAFMLALCSQETVILGHAVNNDLAALRMTHYCVADSSFLFQATDSQTAAVSLKALALAVLKEDMPKKHDSVNDARTALRCLKYYAEHEGNVDAVERIDKSSKNEDKFNSYFVQLFVHRIPKQCDEEQLSNMFLAHTDVKPSLVDPISFTGGQGKTTVNFQTSRHANLAFDMIAGKADTDPSGRMQKKVFLRNGGYIRVRKMAYEKDSSTLKTAPRRSSSD